MGGDGGGEEGGVNKIPSSVTGGRQEEWGIVKGIEGGEEEKLKGVGVDEVPTESESCRSPTTETTGVDSREAGGLAGVSREGIGDVWAPGAMTEGSQAIESS